MGALEALQGSHSDSMAGLGMVSPGSQDQTGNQRVREELHRSLVGNKTKREEISKLEQCLQTKMSEIASLERHQAEQRRQITALEQRLAGQGGNSGQVRELERQNAELRKHVTEIVEGNDTDKQEAIDELREEYEEQVQQAVQGTRQLMDGELKKLRLELEVYEKTLIQVKAGAAEGETTRAGLTDTVTKLQAQLQVGIRST